MKKNKLVSIILKLYIILMTFNKFLQIGVLPIYCIPMVILIFFIIGKVKKISIKNLFLILWMIYSLISMMLIDNIQAFKSTLSLITNISSIIIITELVKEDSSYLEDCFMAIKFSLSIILMTAIYEIISKAHIIDLTTDYQRRFYGVPIAFYANPNDLATILVSLIVILVLNIFYDTSKKVVNKKITIKIDILLIIIAYIIVICTNSTICKVAVPIILVISILLNSYYKFKKRMIVVLIMIIICLLGSLLFVDNTINIGQYDSISSRLIIWKSSINLLSNHILFGIGSGQNEVIGVGQVHCLILEILVEYGIMVFIMFMCMYIKELIFIKNTLIIANQSIKQKKCLSIIFSFLLVLLVLSICTSSMTKLYLVWSCIGMCNAIASLKEGL